MKITSSTQANKPAPTSGGAGSSRAGGAARTSSSGSTTSSSTTDSAARLSQLEAQYSPSDFSAGKVQEISAAIAAGQYRVNPEAVADKLLASTAALGQKSGSAS